MPIEASLTVRLGPLLTVLMGALGCAPSPLAEPPPPAPVAEPPAPSVAKPSSDTPSPAATQPSSNPVDPTPPETATNAIATVSLTDDSTVPVPGTPLTAQMVDAFHKIRAPLVGVSVLVHDDESPTRSAKVDWRIESSKVNSGWRELAGQRWDDSSEAYIEERIPGWLVRLDSLDASTSGGSPSAITISFKRS